MIQIRPISILFLFAVCSIYIHIIFIIGCVVMILDVYARDRDYERLKGKPFSIKLARYYGQSWCGRGVCQKVWPEARYLFYKDGYRWWHILPDGFPLVFIKIDFWKSVVGWGN